MFRHYFSPQQILVNLTMFQDLFRVKNIDGVYWSLLVEVKFYIIIATAFRVFKINLNYILLVAFLLSFVNYLFQGVIPGFEYVEFILILDWIPLFVVGILIYQLSKSSNDIFIKIILLISAYILAFIYSINRMEDLSSHYKVEYSSTVVLVYYLIFILGTILSSRVYKFVIPNWLTSLALATYPMYLIHQMIGYKMIDWLTEDIGSIGALIFTTVLLTMASLLIANFGNYCAKKLRTVNYLS